jgi:hypothetical protein
VRPRSRLTIDEEVFRLIVDGASEPREVRVRVHNRVDLAVEEDDLVVVRDAGIDLAGRSIASGGA